MTMWPNKIAEANRRWRLDLSRSRKLDMRIRLSIVFLGMIMLTGCRPSLSDLSDTSLSFYVVHGEKIAGGQFIDTSEFPKLGFISAMPDLIITQLESAKQTVGPIPEIPRISIMMHPKDAENFRH